MATPQQCPQYPSTQQPNASAPQPDGGRKRPKAGLVAVVAALVTVVVGVVIIFALGGGASSAGSRNASAETDEATVQAKTADIDISKVANSYDDVLDQVAAGGYDFTNPDHPEFEQVVDDEDNPEEYALQDVTGDDVPELLVARYVTEPDSAALGRNVIVFTYADGEAEQVGGATTLYVTSSDNHYWTDLYAKDDSTGVYKRCYEGTGIPIDESGNQDITAELVEDPSNPEASNTYYFTTITVEDGELVESDQYQDVPSDIGEMLSFNDISDRTDIKLLAGESAEDIYDEAVAETRDQGETVYEGTVEVMSGAELLQFEVDHGRLDQSWADQVLYDPDYAPLYAESVNASYTVLVLDDTTTVTALQSGDPGTRDDEADLIDLGDDAFWGDYEGMRVAITVTPEEIMYPSEFTVLNTEPGAIYSLTEDNFVAAK